MIVDLHEQTGGEAESGGIERLDTLAQAHGFAYVVGERSQATLTLARQCPESLVRLELVLDLVNAKSGWTGLWMSPVPAGRGWSATRRLKK